ncbi:hypothetical protein PAXRUDRAFT_133258 [Paxillus rubicundulus Ve08.2h10]|uniref:Clp1-like protein n=1 Tax=Paxillus rubicundulus Ve08.2h10 TaxID=930991 RepID=A0A0D0E8W8_9AGAM|nr:hypothetical protein PAXRUDRAFT_133258 [Paxillus rubicundulus Ve08.2h10]
MVLQITTHVRRLDCENTPPATRLANTKPKVRNGIQAASRRRRARATGGSHHPRYAVEHAKQKSTAKYPPPSINIELSRSSGDVEMSDSTSAISMSTVTLPRYLSRPAFRELSKETISAVAPELADTELNYIRDGLQCLGPDMLQVLAGVKAEPISNVLPKDLPAVVNDLSSDMPTHMLAVYSRQVNATTKRRVTLFPIHNIILAAHCANLPMLPTSNVAHPETAGSSISVPVVPLCIPAPEVFPQLSTFLYTKRIDHLLASLLPSPVPQQLYRDDPTSDSVHNLLQQFASKLATTYSDKALLAHAMAVNGLWRNACALGIDDEKLWCALDVAWEVLITALAISTGKQL